MDKVQIAVSEATLVKLGLLNGTASQTTLQQVSQSIVSLMSYFMNNEILISFLRGWKETKEKEGLIPTVNLLLEELENNEQN